MPINLNVRYPLGVEKDTISMTFQSTAVTAKEVITKASSSLGLDPSLPYCLFNPQGDPCDSKSWLFRSSSLADAHLKQHDTLEIKVKPYPVNIVIYNHNNPKTKPDLNCIPWSSLEKTKQTILFDFSEPLVDIIPVIMKLFPVKGTWDYIFTKTVIKDNNAIVVGTLHLGRSFLEQEMVPNGYILLIHNNVLHLPATRIMNASMSGWMHKISKRQILKTVGTLNSAKLKRWFVLQGRLMYYYQNKTSPAPLGIIDLEYFNLQEGMDKSFVLTKGVNRIPDFCVKTYYLSPEDPDQFSAWVRALRAETFEQATKTVFGIPFNRLWHRKDAEDVPAIVIDCVKFIESRALGMQGLFQEKGSQELLLKLKDAYNSGRSHPLRDFLESERKKVYDKDDPVFKKDAHTVAQLLIQYFASLSYPILTYEFYNDFIRIENKKYMSDLVDLVASLPNANQRVLFVLLPMLHKACEQSVGIEKTSKGIGKAFALYILNKKDATVFDLDKIYTVVDMLIENYKLLKYKRKPRYDFSKGFGPTDAADEYDGYDAEGNLETYTAEAIPAARARRFLTISNTHQSPSYSQMSLSLDSPRSNAGSAPASTHPLSSSLPPSHCSPRALAKESTTSTTTTTTTSTSTYTSAIPGVPNVPSPASSWDTTSEDLSDFLPVSPRRPDDISDLNLAETTSPLESKSNSQTNLFDPDRRRTLRRSISHNSVIASTRLSFAFRKIIPEGFKEAGAENDQLLSDLKNIAQY